MSHPENLPDNVDELIADYVERTAFEGAVGRAKARQGEVSILYQEIARCGAYAGWPEDEAARAELAKKLEERHIFALEETYDTTVGSVTNKGREALFSLMPEIERRSAEYERGSRAEFIATEPALAIPEYPEDIALVDFVHALLVAANVKWMPIKGVYDGREFVVLPTDEEFVIMRQLNRLFAEQA